MYPFLAFLVSERGGTASSYEGFYTEQHKKLCDVFPLLNFSILITEINTCEKGLLCITVMRL